MTTLEIIHKFEQEFDEIIAPYKDSRNYAKLLLFLKKWRTDFQRALLWEEHRKDKDVEKEIEEFFKDWSFDDELDIMCKPNHYSASFDDIKDIARHFAHWQKKQDEKKILTESDKDGLEKEIEYLSKRFPEVSFAKLSRICVHIAKWQKEQDDKQSEDALEYLKEHHSPSEVSDFQAAMNIAVAKAFDSGMEKQKLTNVIE